MRHTLLDDTCYVFDNDAVSTRGSYIHFRREISDHLDLNPRNVAIIGSAKFGWSMSPEKFGAAYNHQESDIDIAIVSRPLFESCWDQIRRAFYNGYDHIRKDHRNEIFAKFLILHPKINYDSMYLRDIRKQMLDLNRIVYEHLKIEDKAKYRIYEDWS